MRGPDLAKLVMAAHLLVPVQVTVSHLLAMVLLLVLLFAHRLLLAHPNLICFFSYLPVRVPTISDPSTIRHRHERGALPKRTTLSAVSYFFSGPGHVSALINTQHKYVKSL